MAWVLEIIALLMDFVKSDKKPSPEQELADAVIKAQTTKDTSALDAITGVSDSTKS